MALGWAATPSPTPGTFFLSWQKTQDIEFAMLKTILNKPLGDV